MSVYSTQCTECQYTVHSALNVSIQYTVHWMSVYSTQCTECQYTVHSALNVSIQYTVHWMSVYSTQCTECQYTVHSALNVSIQYTVHWMSVYSTQCTECQYTVHSALNVSIQYTVHWMSVYSTQCTECQYTVHSALNVCMQCIVTPFRALALYFRTHGLRGSVLVAISTYTQINVKEAEPFAIMNCMNGVGVAATLTWAATRLLVTWSKISYGSRSSRNGEKTEVRSEISAFCMPFFTWLGAIYPSRSMRATLRVRACVNVAISHIHVRNKMATGKKKVVSVLRFSLWQMPSQYFFLNRSCCCSTRRLAGVEISSLAG